MGDSEQEGDDGHAQGWVVSELLQVAAVLALGPNGHLDEAHQREEGHCRAEQGSERVHGPEWGKAKLRGGSGLTWETLCHDGKTYPGPHLWAQGGDEGQSAIGVGGRGLTCPSALNSHSPALHNSQPRPQSASPDALKFKLQKQLLSQATRFFPTPHLVNVGEPQG